MKSSLHGMTSRGAPSRVSCIDSCDSSFYGWTTAKVVHHNAHVLHASVAGGQVAEASPDSFSQHPRYVEMCIRVMDAALQQGLASSIPAWSQTVLQNIRTTCKLPRADLARCVTIH